MSWDLVRKRWSLRKYFLMLDWWEEHGPPPYIAIASYLGMNKRKPKKKQASTGSKETGNLNDLAAMFSASGGMIQ